MAVKTLKNKANKKTGHFICNRCKGEVIIGVLIKGYIYDTKCGEILKGIRDENGKKR